MVSCPALHDTHTHGGAENADGGGGGGAATPRQSRRRRRWPDDDAGGAAAHVLAKLLVSLQVGQHYLTIRSVHSIVYSCCFFLGGGGEGLTRDDILYISCIVRLEGYMLFVLIILYPVGKSSYLGILIDYR